MSEIRPWELVRAPQAGRLPARGTPRADEDVFEAFLGDELTREASRPGHAGSEMGVGAPDREFLAAELACRQALAAPQPSGQEQGQLYPIQTAYFLRNQRRPETSPMRALRLGGVLKAATLQLRSGVPATGTC